MASGLEIENGIRADATLATSDPDIFAAGDCCSFPHRLYSDKRIRLVAWRNAQDQAAHVVCNMLGASKPYQEIPWFWSDQYELTLQITGTWTPGGDQMLLSGRHHPRICYSRILSVYRHDRQHAHRRTVHFKMIIKPKKALEIFIPRAYCHLVIPARGLEPPRFPTRF
ncbi:MAG: hypothetical protein J7501_15310 [Bdellovibrio sp.]|nr:hypothetical protein [Bdellovibrio sp.]